MSGLTVFARLQSDLTLKKPPGLVLWSHDKSFPLPNSQLSFCTFPLQFNSHPHFSLTYKLSDSHFHLLIKGSQQLLKALFGQTPKKQICSIN